MASLKEHSSSVFCSSAVAVNGYGLSPGGARSVGEHKPPQQQGRPHGGHYLQRVYRRTGHHLHHLRGTPLPLLLRAGTRGARGYAPERDSSSPRRSATRLPALSSSQALRFCAPASRRVCLYRGTGVRAHAGTVATIGTRRITQLQYLLKLPSPTSMRKALFVKADLAASVWPGLTDRMPFALCFHSHSE